MHSHGWIQVRHFCQECFIGDVVCFLLYQEVRLCCCASESPGELFSDTGSWATHLEFQFPWSGMCSAHSHYLKASQGFCGVARVGSHERKTFQSLCLSRIYLLMPPSQSNNNWSSATMSLCPLLTRQNLPPPTSSHLQ